MLNEVPGVRREDAVPSGHVPPTKLEMLLTADGNVPPFHCWKGGMLPHGRASSQVVQQGSNKSTLKLFAWVNWNDGWATETENICVYKSSCNYAFRNIGDECCSRPTGEPVDTGQNAPKTVWGRWRSDDVYVNVV